MIQEQIRKELTAAMKEKDATRMSVLRGLITAFTNELVATKRKPDEALPDEDARKVIQRQVKQRKDSIEQYTKGDRVDLADKEKEELVILETYMPEMMNEEDIEKVVKKKKAELGISDTSKAGVLVGAVMKELKGKADGALVKEVVGALLANT